MNPGTALSWHSLHKIQRAAIIMHIHVKNGSVFALDGEFLPEFDSIIDHDGHNIAQFNNNHTDLDCCDSAVTIDIALAEYASANGTDHGIKKNNSSKWLSERSKAASFEVVTGKPMWHINSCEVSASREREMDLTTSATGDLLAVALSLTTCDCQNGDGSATCEFGSDSLSNQD